jgi:ribosome-binding protein aMBF1 (putative translation factor)
MGVSICHLCNEKQSKLIKNHPMKKPMKTNVNAIGKKVALDTKEMKSLVGGFKDAVRTARELGSRAV